MMQEEWKSTPLCEHLIFCKLHSQSRQNNHFSIKEKHKSFNWKKTFENSLNFSLKTKEIFRLRERVHFLVFIKPCPPIHSDNNERENYKVTAASGNRLSRKWIVERTFPKKKNKEVESRGNFRVFHFI